MTFIQIIDYESDHRAEMKALMDEYVRQTRGRRTSLSALLTHDRDNPRHYVDIVEFPSYEIAMRNSNMPETQEFAARLRALCSAGPTFLNLEVEPPEHHDTEQAVGLKAGEMRLAGSK
jgi:quinol monooxygenase YgiN